MNIETVVTFSTLLVQIILVVGVIAYFFNNKAKFLIRKYAGEFGYLLSFFIALFSTLISLYFSEIVGWEPCILCWYQRIVMYPLVVVFAIGVMKQDMISRIHGLSLAVIGLIIALYQIYLQIVGSSGIACSAIGAADCSEIYLLKFGYITFPVMAATAFLSIILVMLIKRRDTIES